MEAPECPVCLQVYSQEEAIPRVLSCGHTICQPCLQQLPPHLPNSIRCPECNQVAKYPAQGPSGLPKNIDLLRLIPHSTAPRTCERAASSNSIKNSSDGLFPAFLTDGNYRIWKDWVIPSEVIQVLQDRGESDASLGTATSSWLGLRKNQMVGLWPLFAGGGDSCRSAIRLGYRLRVLKVLDVLSPLEKDELMLLLKASAMDRRLCKLYGLWLNFEGRAFLVGEKFRQEDSKIWDGLRGGYLEKSLGSLVDSGDVMIGFSGLALEICEALMGLHSQGIVLGFVSPLCFKLDEYGHVLIDLSSSLMEKKRIHEAFSGSTVDESKEVEFDNLVERQLFMSPEVFRRLYNGNLGLDSSTSRLNNSSTESDSETSVGYKSDVWSLACMLIKLILGNSFVCQYLSSYYRYGIAASRESIGASADDYNSWINKVVADMTPVCGAKFEELQHMLSKCLDHDLNKRPQVSDVWKCLKPIFDGCGFDDFQMHFQQDNIEWCLVLGHIYSAPRRFDSSPEMKKGPRLEKANPVGLDDLSGLASGSCSSVNFDQTVLEKLDHIVVQQVPDDGAKIVTLKGHLDCITGLAIGGGYLLSSSFDKTVRVWSLKDFCYVQSFRCHGHRVTAIVVVGTDEPLCISADSGGSIFVWGLDPTPGLEPLKNWHEHSDWRYSGVHSLAVSGVEILYSGSGDKSIKAWSLKDYSLICVMTGHKSVVSSLSVNNGILYSGSWDGTVRLWWISDHSPFMVLEENPPTAMSSVLSLSVDEDVVAAAHENGMVKIWENGALVKLIKIDDGPVLSVDMKGEWLFASSWNKTISIQELCKDESQLNIRSAGCIDCDSVATSLLYYEGKLFVGLSNKDIKVYVRGS